MPTSPVPFVHPSLVTFYSTQMPQQEKLCIFNPFPHDIVFKIDNPSPDLFTLSQTQGYINSSNKLYVELNCNAQTTNFNGVLQVRFFRCSRPRRGHRPHTQEYVGFREVQLNILINPNERQKTSTEGELVSLSTRDLSKSQTGSNLDSASTRSSSADIEHHSLGRRIQVLTCLFLAIILLLVGFIISQTNEVWFVATIGGVTTWTFAVMCYTLSCVLFIRLLTLR